MDPVVLPWDRQHEHAEEKSFFWHPMVVGNLLKNGDKRD